MGFRLPTGKYDCVEIFGTTKQDPNLYPDSTTGLMIAFIVDDVMADHTDLVAAGIEPLGDVIWVTDGFGWYFPRAPDSNIYYIEQNPGMNASQW
jgi:hypothetical protein